MPKRGARQPWRVTFQYATQAKTSARPCYDREEAEAFAAELQETAQRRGVTVTIEIRNRDTGEVVDMMAKNDVNSEDGAKALEQIKANIERIRSLAAAGDTDALGALREETESLISSLTGKGSIKVKKEQRDAMAEAAETKPSAEVAKPALEGEVVGKSWDEYEGVKELAVMGAEKLAEGIRLHLKTSDLARDMAAVVFDMWKRIPNKDGMPDLRGDSDDAKKSWKWLLAEAGQGFERSFETEEALAKLQRAVQRQRTDIRAKYLRSLDADTDEAQAERKLYRAKLADWKGDSDVSAFLADYYRVSLKGEIEADREKYQRKLEGNDAPPQLEPVDPNKLLADSVRRISTDLRKMKPEELVNASDEVKAEARRKLDELREQMKTLVTALM